MDEFEQSGLGKETDDSHNIFYQNAKHYKERENALIEKNYKCAIFSLVFVIKPGRGTYD